MSASAPSAFTTRTLGDIAATLPGATGVFRRHKLDFCCGGEAVLADAAAAKGLPLAGITQELDAIAALALPPTAPASTEDLIGMIETRYHAAHRRDLPELIRLAHRVEAAHRHNPRVPAGLAALFEEMQTELESHMRKEEEALFPMMRRGGGKLMAPAIAVMLEEHDDQGDYLRRMEELTGEFTTPADGCATWRALSVGGRKFADDLVEHIHTENNILFPRFANQAAD